MHLRRASRVLVAALGLALVTAGTAPGDEGLAAPDAARPETGFRWASIGEVAFDVVILRPLGAVATAAGLAFFTASMPLVLVSDEFGTTWDVFVGGPADYTFARPIGEF
jgi:hypothetical protein